jgi:hypothetical protein
MPLGTQDFERTLDSHEARIERTEMSIQQLIVQQSVQGSHIDALIGKMGDLMDTIKTHGTGDTKTQMRLHDLEMDQSKRNSFNKTVTWIIGTILAAVAGDIVIRFLSLIRIK